MFVITRSKDNVIEGLSSTVTTLETDYIKTDRNVVMNPKNVTLHEIDNLPVNIERIKYCYTEEKGFYVNPDWVEPEVEDPIQEYRDQLASEVSEIGYDA